MKYVGLIAVAATLVFTGQEARAADYSYCRIVELEGVMKKQHEEVGDGGWPIYECEADGPYCYATEYVASSTLGSGKPGGSCNITATCCGDYGSGIGIDSFVQLDLYVTIE